MATKKSQISQKPNSHDARQNSAVPKKSKNSLLFALIPVACAILFMVLCALRLRGSIWFDEAYSAYLIRGDFSQIWSLTAADVHPPFFYFCLKIWSLIFGTTDFALRFMSVFFGALGLILTFYLIKRHFGIKPATFASLFLAISPMFIRYGQEMRMYTLVFFIVIAATYVLDLILETHKTRYYIIYAILIALGMWTHYFAALAWIAHIIYCVTFRREKIFTKKWLLTYAGAVLLYVPWLPSFVAQVFDVQKGFWVEAISIVTPVDFLTKSLTYIDAGSVTNWLAALILIALGLMIYVGKRVYHELDKTKKTKFILLLSLIILPPLVLMILSLPPFSPVFVERYIVYSAVLIWAFAGLIIALCFDKNTRTKTSTKISAIALCATMLICGVVGVIKVDTGNGEPDYYHLKNIVQSVQAIADTDEPIIASNEWIYYDAIFYSTDEKPIYGVDSWIDYQYGSMFPIREYRYNLIDNLDDFLQDKDKFWYIINLNRDYKTIDDYQLTVDGYRVVGEVSDENYIVLELEKDAR